MTPRRYTVRYTIERAKHMPIDYVDKAKRQPRAVNGKFAPYPDDHPQAPAKRRGRKPVAGLDARYKPARRILAIRQALLADLGEPTERLRIQATHAAMLAVQVEDLQQASLRGETVDLEQLSRLSNLMARALKALPRSPAKTTPKGQMLKNYLASKEAPGADRDNLA
jgi:hypothetical protein